MKSKYKDYIEKQLVKIIHEEYEPTDDYDKVNFKTHYGRITIVNGIEYLDLIRAKKSLILDFDTTKDFMKRGWHAVAIDFKNKKIRNSTSYKSIIN